MLTTHANNPKNNATNATNDLLATNPPGYTGGRLAAEQAGGAVSSRGREQSSNDLHPGQWRYTDATGTRVGNLPAGDDALWDFIARADARFGIVEDSARWAAIVGKRGKGK